MKHVFCQIERMIVVFDIIAKVLFRKGMERGAKNLFCLMSRIHYFLRHAIYKTIEDTQSNFVKICYNNQEYDVQVIDDINMLDTLEFGRSINIRWIPGKSIAKLWPYANNKRIQKTVFICDVISILSLLAIIILLILNYKKITTGGIYAILGSVILMIIMSIIRKKLSIKTKTPDESNKLDTYFLSE